MKQKMKRILAFVILSCFWLPLLSQNAYYDALKLVELDDFIKKNQEAFNALIDQDKKKYDALKSFLDDPIGFIKEKNELPSITETIAIFKKALGKKGGESAVQFIPSAPSEAASFSYKSFQRDIIDAVGTLIAERLKEDITNIYLNKFKAKMKKTKGYEYVVKPLFPGTTTLIDEENPFSYFSLGTEWKAAFKKDLEALPENMLKFLDAMKNDKSLREKYPDLIKEELYNHLILAIDISNKLIHGYQPLDILEYLDSKFKEKKDNPYYQSLHTFNLFQRNLQKIEKTTENEYDEESDTSGIKNKFSGWLSYSELNNLFLKEKGLSYFLALVYLQDKTFFKESEIGEKLEKIAEFTKEYLNPCLEILYRLNALNEKLNKSKEDYLSDIALVLDIFDKTCEYIKIKGFDKNKLDSFFEILRDSLEIYKAVYQKNYFFIIGNAFSIMEKIVPELGKSGTADEDVNKIRSIKVIKQFSTFIEGIATAQNSEQMKAVISAVTLPRGGFMTTRTAKRTFSITAHPGVYVGFEKLNPEGEAAAKWGAVLGFTAPLGFEHCWGLKGCLKGTSLGIFLSVFDLGAVASYRLPKSEDKYKGLPDDLSLKQIVSPGLSVNIGIKNSPITIGVGYQYTPELRKIIEEKADDNSIVTKMETKANTGRLFLRFSWSMPFVHISRKM